MHENDPACNSNASRLRTACNSLPGGITERLSAKPAHPPSSATERTLLCPTAHPPAPFRGAVLDGKLGTYSDRVYPVLVGEDPILQTIAMNTYLNDIFREYIERSPFVPDRGPTIVCRSCGDTMKHFRTISKLGVRREQLMFVCPSCKGVDTKERAA